MLDDWQAKFRTALLSGNPKALRGLVVGGPAQTDRTFRIYHRTFIGLLVDALEKTYPVVRQLVGEGFFRACGAEFVHTSPPKVPELLEYGEDFATFLKELPAAKSLPYLSEVARLEWAIQRSLIAVDAPLVDVEALEQLPPARAQSVRFELHPSVRFVHSAVPIRALWEAHQRPDPDLSGLRIDYSQQEKILVVRSDRGVFVRTLSEGDFAFLQALERQSTLTEAAHCGLACDARFDLSAILSVALRDGLFTRAT